MNEQNSGLMEEEIIGEDMPEKNSQPEKQSTPKYKNNTDKPQITLTKVIIFIKFIRNPKFIIIFLLFLAIIVIITTFVSNSSKLKNSPIFDTNTVIATPLEPENQEKPIDSEIQKKLDQFSNKIDNLNSEQIDFSPPYVDFKSLSVF